MSEGRNQLHEKLLTFAPCLGELYELNLPRKVSSIVLHTSTDKAIVRTVLVAGKGKLLVEKMIVEHLTSWKLFSGADTGGEAPVDPDPPNL